MKTIQVFRAIVEDTRASGLQATVRVETSEGDVWVSAGVPEEGWSDARASGLAPNATVVPYGADRAYWCPDALLNEPVDDIIGAVRYKAMRAWREVRNVTEHAVKRAQAMQKYRELPPESQAVRLSAIRAGAWAIRNGALVEVVTDMGLTAFVEQYQETAEDRERMYALALGTCESLQELLEVLWAYHREATATDLGDLPTFGGAPPADTAGVWSWDADGLLVGRGPIDEMRIVSRADWPAKA